MIVDVIHRAGRRCEGSLLSQRFAFMLKSLDLVSNVYYMCVCVCVSRVM